MKMFGTFARDESGGPAAEFALVLPIALLFFFGIIDVGRFMWEYNQAEKATQMGARFAAVTDFVPTGLGTYTFVGVGGLTQGDPVPAGAYGTMTCSKPGVAAVACTCSGTCGWGSTADPTPFQAVVSRMALFFPKIAASNVLISYGPSGLGYAGDPNGPDIAPLITVQLTGLQFKPLMLFNAVAINMPDFSYSLTMEDGAGTTSN
jgi:TadE-like protein